MLATSSIMFQTRVSRVKRHPMTWRTCMTCPYHLDATEVSRRMALKIVLQDTGQGPSLSAFPSMTLSRLPPKPL